MNELKKAENLLKEKEKAKEEPKPDEKELEKAKKELEQLKTKLEAFKKSILKKFPFLSAISLIPPQGGKFFDEEIEKQAKEEKEKFIHIYMLIPDEKQKEFGKVKVEAIKLIQDIKPKVWINLSFVRDLWEICFDGKYEMLDAIAMSMPLHDKGVLGALRVANVHKILCLKKFEHYIVSYVIAGSLVKGGATKTSDVDSFIIVDDTDVKRITRMELRDKLRSIIYGYTVEAADITGVHNKLSPQIYLLTEFWDGVREANPIFFTFIRDGVPLYDKGTFTPWKLLLRMGKITGTPEAIEKFMTLGEKVGDIVRKKLTDLAVEDIYWSVLTPSQGALMIYGLAPPTPKETVHMMRKIFYEKEKLLEKKYIDFLEHVVIDIYKAYEHEKLKKVSGKEIDELVKDAEEYISRLKKLVEEVGKRMSEKTILRLHEDLILLLNAILGKGSEKQLLERFKKELIETGKLSAANLKILEKIFKARKDYAKGKLEKLSRQEVERIRKDAQQLIGSLTEYSQRGRLMELEKLKFSVLIDKKEGELYLIKNKAFIIPDIKKPELTLIDLEKNAASKAGFPELEEALKKPEKAKLTSQVLNQIEKLLGKKIEITF